ncbi:50S ribosomal protein L4 [Candidatus Kaiserbacteria bacterium CG10_big_fil_rev_8_21_14_0_10_49_17]|uniref:Large ribosomal subunit protein uL4 n=1 Tax=Candidatus Kaiserbacteria bacterium CG10_big_fil_rev_8_21_14_0_10_49_17 TaxID=1974609 RepID=A0A2M6WEJ2_9BACT|nr:MAG: 50S ribosomal protein L4 [Candidatus Kaiserbacteria bacterium CG10_big_fil_rev_8_21_14_0_10_49_17]
MDAVIYNKEGKEAGKVSLPESVFNTPFNADLVHQVVTTMQNNARTMVAHTKDRSEVRGGGRKPWRQKGTGRARHGSRRSPIWRGGGVTFGPRSEKDYTGKLNRKMKVKALYSVLSKKMKDGEVLFVDDLGFAEPKAKEAKQVLTALSRVKGFEGLARKKNAAFIALDEFSEVAAKSFGNFGNVEVDAVANLNPVDVLRFKYLIITKPEESLAVLEAKHR